MLRLLRSVHQVTKDYENLHREILEVQQLQKQLSDSLKAQLSQVVGHFNLLRNKIDRGTEQKSKNEIKPKLLAGFFHSFFNCI